MNLCTQELQQLVVVKFVPLAKKNVQKNTKFEKNLYQSKYDNISYKTKNKR